MFLIHYKKSPYFDGDSTEKQQYTVTDFPSSLLRRNEISPYFSREILHFYMCYITCRVGYVHDGVSGTVLRTVGVKASVTCFNAIPIPVEILVLSLVVI